MKQVIWIIGGLLVTAAIATLVLHQSTGRAHVRDVAIATGITLVSAIASLVPLFLTGKASPVAVFQAAFGGTVIHLFLTLALGAAAHAMRWVDRGIFLFLLMAFYWFSLIFVVTAMIKIFRRSVASQSASHDLHAKGL